MCLCDIPKEVHSLVITAIFENTASRKEIEKTGTVLGEEAKLSKLFYIWYLMDVPSPVVSGTGC